MYPDTLPWYRSKIIVGAAISIITKLLVATGVLDVAIDDSALTDIVLLLIGGVADLWIMLSRVRQEAAPKITASK
jgi:hypothetical protein